MLSVLRHKGVAKKILWVVTGIIILSFAIFGTAYRLDNQINSAGTIYGQGVNYRDFQKAYLDARDQAIILYGDQFFKAGQNLDLEREAWDRLILMREVEKQRIKISNQEVVDFIAQLPFFQRQGQFDQSLYQSLITESRIFDRNTRDFEEGIRHNIAIRKLLDTTVGSLTISDDELKKEYTRRNEKITLDYILIPPADFSKGVSVSTEDVNAFYAKNKEAFRQPTMIKVDYVQITLNDKATKEEKEAAKTNIYNLSAQLTPTSDFATVAKKFNLEVKSSDYFTLEQPILTFASSPEETTKMFALKNGQFTKPLSVPDGWQIVRINDKKESHVPELATITNEVKAALINDKAYGEAKKKADEILVKLKEGIKASDFKTTSTALGLKVEQTPSFGRGEYIANVGLVRELQQDALNLTASNSISEVILTSQGPVIVHLAKAEPIDEKEYAQGKEEFKNMFEAQRRQQKISMFMTQLRLAANVKSKIKK